MDVRAAAIRSTHRLVDFVLRVDPKMVLNPDPRPGPPLPEVLPDLRRFVAGDKIDYTRLRETPAYRRYGDAVAALHDATPPRSPEAARAWWVNLYNGLIIHAVIEFRIRRSVLWEDFGFFRRAAYTIGGRRMSADDIEHGVLRGNRRHPFLWIPQFAPGDPRRAWSLPMDPRVHFTLVCATNSCPAINLYRSEQLDTQLDAAAGAFINGGGVRVDGRREAIILSRIFKWYEGDFGGRAGVLDLVARHLTDEETRALARRPGVRVRYERYDWSLNHPAMP